MTVTSSGKSTCVDPAPQSFCVPFSVIFYDSILASFFVAVTKCQRLCNLLLLYSSILWRLKITMLFCLASGKCVITEEKMEMNKREALCVIKKEGKCYASLLFNSLNIYVHV